MGMGYWIQTCNHLDYLFSFMLDLLKYLFLIEELHVPSLFAIVDLYDFVT